MTVQYRVSLRRPTLPVEADNLQTLLWCGRSPVVNRACTSSLDLYCKRSGAAPSTHFHGSQSVALTSAAVALRQILIVVSPLPGTLEAFPVSTQQLLAHRLLKQSLFQACPDQLQDSMHRALGATRFRRRRVD